MSFAEINLLQNYKLDSEMINMDVIDVQVVRFLKTNRYSDVPESEKLETSGYIKGIAKICDNNTIAEIDSEREPIKQLSFSLHTSSGNDSLSKEWEELKRIRGNRSLDIDVGGACDYSTRLTKSVQYSYSLFDNDPPTVYLGLDDESCSLSCTIPKASFDALVRDFVNGRCNTFSLSITLAPTLVNEYGRCGLIFGILRMGNSKHAHSHGWIDAFSWVVGQNNSALTIF